FLDDLVDSVRERHYSFWRQHAAKLNAELRDRAPELYTRLVLESLLARTEVRDERVRRAMREWHRVRYPDPQRNQANAPADEHHHHGRRLPPLAVLDPVPELAAVQSECAATFARGLDLWPRDRVDLAGSGGELDRAMQMPGWTNVW